MPKHLSELRAEPSAEPRQTQVELTPVELTPAFTAAQANAPFQPPSGGDFSTAFPLHDGTDDVAVVLGDVAGHGPEQTQQAEHLKELLSDCLSAGLTPAETLTAVNALTETDPNFPDASTAFVGTLHAQTGTLTYASGGQEPGLIADPETADPSGGAAGRVEQLEATGSLVGAFSPELTAFEQHETVMPPGATLLLYSDGVSEARPPHDRTRWLGVEGLKVLLAGLARLSPHRLLPALLRRVSAFCRGRFNDDVSVLAIRRRKASVPSPQAEGTETSTIKKAA